MTAYRKKLIEVALPLKAINAASARENSLREVRSLIQRASPAPYLELFGGEAARGWQLTGEFQGILPKARTFEFRLGATGEVVRGKVGPGIADPDVINDHLHMPVTIAVLATSLGNGRPRYSLDSLPEWRT